MIEHQDVLVKLILLVVFFVGPGTCVDTYGIGFNEGLSGCNHFANDFLNGDSMDLGKTCEDGEEAMFLQGCLEFTNSISEGTFIDIDVSKETEVGSEPMWSSSMDVCKSLNDEEAPWAEAMKSMNITGCPVEPGKYCCNEFRLDMDFANNFLNHKYKGNYETLIKIWDGQRNDLSCHLLGLSIFLKEEDK